MTEKYRSEQASNKKWLNLSRIERIGSYYILFLSLLFPPMQRYQSSLTRYIYQETRRRKYQRRSGGSMLSGSSQACWYQSKNQFELKTRSSHLACVFSSFTRLPSNVVSPCANVKVLVLKLNYPTGSIESRSFWHSTALPVILHVETFNGEFRLVDQSSDRSWTRSKTFNFRRRRRVWPYRCDKLIKFIESDHWSAKRTSSEVMLFNSFLYIEISQIFYSRLSSYQLNFGHSVYEYNSKLRPFFWFSIEGLIRNVHSSINEILHSQNYLEARLKLN